MRPWFHCQNRETWQVWAFLSLHSIYNGIFPKDISCYIYAEKVKIITVFYQTARMCVYCSAFTVAPYVTWSVSHAHSLGDCSHFRRVRRHCALSLRCETFNTTRFETSDVGKINLNFHSIKKSFETDQCYYPVCYGDRGVPCRKFWNIFGFSGNRWKFRMNANKPLLSFWRLYHTWLENVLVRT